MNTNEELWMKISDDFHREINEILLQLEPGIENEFWVKQNNVSGKFHVINNILLSINPAEVSVLTLTRLSSSLTSFKKRLIHYFDNFNLATGFLFFAPENIRNADNYFRSIEGVALTSTHIIAVGSMYFIGMEVVGFPNDCTKKFTARLKAGEIKIDERHDPLFPIEKERGEIISKTNRTRGEQTEILNDIKKVCKMPGQSLTHLPKGQNRNYSSCLKTSIIA